MGRFLIHTGVLFLLFLAVNLLFPVIFNYPRENYVPSVTKASHYLFGDSHAATNTIPDSLRSEWFNFAYGSDDFADVLNKLAFLKDRGYLDSTSTVIVELDLQLFSSYRASLNNNDLSGLFVNSPRSWINYYAPLLGDKRILSPQILFRGVGKEDMNAVVRLGTLRDSMNFRNRFNQQFGTDFSLEPYYFDLAHDIREFCVQSNTRLLGVIYPVHPYYKQLLHERTRYRELRDSVAMVFQDSEFLDLSDSITHPVYFRDQDHLNRAGSAKLIEILSAYLERATKTSSP